MTKRPRTLSQLALATATLLATLSVAATPTTSPTSRPIITHPLGATDSPPDANLNFPPPAPVPLLSPQDAIKTMKLPRGFHVELAAAEPMIEHPVSISFDADGRMWVCEMRAYMPDADAVGDEKAPTGRISILTDTHGDGHYDKCTVFLDHLVLPRTVSCVRGGALVAIPPNVYFCKDTNGDDVCDQKTLVASDFGLTGNPEHQPNGLVPMLDNWLYSANYEKRLRFEHHTWISEPIPDLGQWGIAQDDFGRLFHNNNSDVLRASLIPPHYATRNPHYPDPRGANEPVVRDQTCFPAHPTAVNRGYEPKSLRPDGTLRKVTACCGPVIYRGDLFPKEYKGNAFAAEPSANLIKRIVLTDHGESIEGANPYKDDEFLTSTYERFRPVFLANGPDGALYVVDMHEGLLQHKVYLTTYARHQYLARDLEKYQHTGRIYRIVPDHPPSPPTPVPHLSTASTPQLIASLSNPNGWTRDTAQRLLVEQQDYKAIPQLKKLAASSPNPLARLHALWTLEGFGTTGPSILLPALHDSDPHLRAAAIRIAEPHLHSATPEPLLSAVMALQHDPDPLVRLQFALTITPLGTPQSDTAIASLLSTHPDSVLLRDAVITGLPGRELQFLQFLLSSSAPAGSASADAAPAPHSPASDARDPYHLPSLILPPSPSPLLTSLAHCVLSERNPKHIASLLNLIAAHHDPHTRTALLAGLLPPAPRGRRTTPPPMRPVLLPNEPTAFLSLQNSPDQPTSRQASAILSYIHWPGQPGYTPPPPPPPLTPAQQQLFNHGAQIFAATCAACHKPTGLGQAGLAPPLLDSEWVLGPPSRITRIVLNGLTGPVTVDGRTFSLDMPGLGSLPDTDLAAVLTFVRRNWDHTASPIPPEYVQALRAQTQKRPLPWTEPELLQIPDDSTPTTPHKPKSPK